MASQQTGQAYEEENVHAVYQEIAQHFSATRFKVCGRVRLRMPTNPLSSRGL